MNMLKLANEFAQKITDVLTFKSEAVEEWFDVIEDKQGFFCATLRPKKWLSDLQFRGMCGLVRDLGGDYVKGFKMFRVPGPLAKKSPTEPTTSPKQPSSVTPNDVVDDKNKPHITVPVKALSSMPFQSRTRPEVGIDELAESIRTVGVLHPILVRPKPNGLYEVVMGERRVAAAKKLGFIDIPANIRILSDQEAYEIQFTENIQREDLTDLEKAHWLDFMTKKFGYTQDQLAKKLGKTKGWVSQHIAMLDLEKVYPGKLQTGEITERQAREILAAPENKQQEIINEINRSGEVPSAREIHDLVHPETVKPQDVTVGKAKEILDTPAGREVLIDAVKEAMDKGEIPASLDKEEPLYAESIETAEGEHEPIEDSEKTGVGSPEPHHHKLEGTQVSEFTCTECNQHFFIDHITPDKHRLTKVRSAPE